MEVYGWQVYELPTPNGVGIHKTPHSPQPVRRGSLHPLDDAKDNANGLLVVSKTCHDLRVLEMEELSASSPLARNELFGVGMVKTL